MKEISIKKGKVLQRQGDLNSKVYLVQEGLLRSYIIDEKGKEHIFMFAPEKWVIADCRPPEEPCQMFIDALEDSVVLVLPKDLKKENNNGGPLIRRLAVLQERVLMLMSSSAIVRYEYFIEAYPEISQRVPQRMIASYLGITPEALSKVKGKRAKKK